MMHVTRQTRACGIAGLVTVTLPAAPWEAGEPWTPRPPAPPPPPDTKLADRILRVLAAGPLSQSELRRRAHCNAAALIRSLELLRLSRAVIRDTERRYGQQAYIWRLP